MFVHCVCYLYFLSGYLDFPFDGLLGMPLDSITYIEQLKSRNCSVMSFAQCHMQKLYGTLRRYLIEKVKFKKNWHAKIFFKFSRRYYFLQGISGFLKDIWSVHRRSQHSCKYYPKITRKSGTPDSWLWTPQIRCFRGGGGCFFGCILRGIDSAKRTFLLYTLHFSTRLVFMYKV